MTWLREFTGTVYLCGSCGQPCFDGEHGAEHFSEQWDGVQCPWFPLAGTRLVVEWDEVSLSTLRAQYPDTYPRSGPEVPVLGQRRRRRAQA